MQILQKQGPVIYKVASMDFPIRYTQQVDGIWKSAPSASAAVTLQKIHFA